MTFKYAALAGKIAWICDIFLNDGRNATGPYGIIIDHGSNLYTMYGHSNNAAPNLKIEDWVMAGQHIADVGERGFAPEPFLYFRVIDGVTLSEDIRNAKFTPEPFGNRIKMECPYYVDPTPLFLSRDESSSIIGNLNQFK